MRRWQGARKKLSWRLGEKLKRDALSALVCPYCGGALQEGAATQEANDEILLGTARCDCSEFPIVDGILILRDTPVPARLIALAKAGSVSEALALCLSDRGESLLHSTDARTGNGVASRAVTGWTKIRAFHQISEDYHRFSEGGPLVGLLEHDRSGEYFKHRFSLESFWPLYSMTPILAERAGTILDVGAGIGHSTFVLSEYVRPRHLIYANQSFWQTYLGKHFMAPKAACIVLDANYALPFATGYCDGVVAIDMLHSLLNRAGLAHEIQRVLSDRGVAAVLHLHNSLVFNFGPTHPMTPEGWSRLFAGGNTRAFPEPRVIRELLQEDAFDASRPQDPGELRSANALIHLTSRDPTVFRPYKGVRAALTPYEGHLRVNPMYEARRTRRGFHLTRRFPSILEDEFPVAKALLPEEVDLSVPETDTGQPDVGELDPKVASELTSKFVLLNTPPRYA